MLWESPKAWIACQNRKRFRPGIYCRYDNRMVASGKIHPRRCTMKVSQGIHCWLESHKLHSKKTLSKPTSRSFQNWPLNLVKETSTPFPQKKSSLSSPKSIKGQNKQPKGPGTPNWPLSSTSSLRTSIPTSEAHAIPLCWKGSIDPLDSPAGLFSKRKPWMKSSFVRSNPETGWCLNWWPGVEWGSARSCN